MLCIMILIYSHFRNGIMLFDTVEELNLAMDLVAR